MGGGARSVAPRFAKIAEIHAAETQALVDPIPLSVLRQTGHDDFGEMLRLLSGEDLRRSTMSCSSSAMRVCASWVPSVMGVNEPSRSHHRI